MIQTVQDFQQLATMTDTAQECIESMRFGSHFLLMATLAKKFGVRTNDRIEAIKAARRLLDEFITAQNAD